MTRIDEATQQRVIDELAAEDNLRTSIVGVSVKSGTVHLTGVVPTAADFATAERLVRGVPGVTKVVNDLMAHSLLANERT